MKIIFRILTVAAVVVVAGCLLSPPVYWLGRFLVSHGLVSSLGDVKFTSYFNRTVMVLGLLSLWPMLRWCGLRRWTDLMLESNPRRFSDLGIGVALGAGGFAYALGLLLLGGIVRLRGVLPWGDAWMLVLTAIAVPLIEEAFFRGALFGLLRRSLKWPWALVFLSIFFAILHFLRPKPGAVGASGRHWHSGFEHVTQLFWQFSELRLVLGVFVTLFLVGLILGYTVVRTRSLYMAVGLHGGWVLAMRVYDEFMRRAHKNTIWVGKDVRNGLAAVLLLVATLGIVFLLLRRRTPAPAGVAEQSRDEATAEVPP